MGSGYNTSDFVDSSPVDDSSYSLSSRPLNQNLSADSSRLVFTSSAPDTGASATGLGVDTNVFVRNTNTGQTSLVSVAPDGTAGNGSSFDPQISPDGRYVAFVSLATNLTTIGGQTPKMNSSQAVGNLYVRDLQTQTTILLDQTPGGLSSDGWSTGQFVFSPDSQSLAWLDTSDNLTTAPVEAASPGTPFASPSSNQSPTYVYMRDLPDQTTTLMSLSTAGQASGSEVIDPSGTNDLLFSPNSRFLVFGSDATDLTANQPDNSSSAGASSGLPTYNLFIHDLVTGSTSLLSATSDGQLPLGAALAPSSALIARPRRL